MARAGYRDPLGTGAAPLTGFSLVILGQLDMVREVRLRVIGNLTDLDARKAEEVRSGSGDGCGGAVRTSRVEVRSGVVSELRASESGRCEMDKGYFITMRCWGCYEVRCCCFSVPPGIKRRHGAEEDTVASEVGVGGRWPASTK
jgi:hypothetical protein